MTNTISSRRRSGNCVLFRVRAAVPSYADPRHHAPVARIRRGYLRVFLTGENFEPGMDGCELP